MINVHFYKKGQQFVALEMSGHAESGPYGQDLVCAGVSALTIAMVNNLKRMSQLEPIVEADQEQGGYLYVSLPENLSLDQKEISQLLFQQLFLALADDMQASYGDFIQVKEKNIN
ncbi:hypothetical protein AWM75_07135 [Aerococcus urinaehominis]|uniref:Ribosomal processing cysteine protease Prp n=1 Tax=Aerococcus urinaehominis TaxID=128944 RepID=A0A0X8FLZ6_9LACT|nr:ribosomal-processing cysteine protease Prp [Aerococcus urinaehominis]AMB99749.1 hypothetical protein AWM75_07135 [Aerococcus urinaehominis]SDM10396.1 hypothetical protein SAMN04487985_10561 [Aerococcus urinaehominis]